MKKVPSTMLSRAQLVATMEKTSLFGGLPQETRKFIADLSQVFSYSSNEAIVLKNTPSDSFFVIIEGTARVEIEDHREVALLRECDVFGEVGALLGTPRTATIVAKEEVIAMVLSKRHFMACFQKFPEFGLVVSKVLANRLSSTLDLLPEHHEDEEVPEKEIIELHIYRRCQWS